MILAADTLADSTSVEPLTHQEFVDSCLSDLAESTLRDFTPNRSRPIVIFSDPTDSTSFADTVAAILSARGMLIRDEGPENADAGNWSLRYELMPLLTLTDPKHDGFLGRVWLKRSLQASLQMSVRDDVDGEEVWSGAADTTFVDFVPKEDLKKLSGDAYNPHAPSTGLEKAKVPLIVGAVAAAVGLVLLVGQ